MFLSHSGADTEARELRRRILASPAARDAGLKVWSDKDENDLVPGKEWQNQLELVLTKKATAFADYVGSKGVINWVEREVRLALSRATGENDLPLIPILAPESAGSAALPPSAAQYHGVRDPSGDEKALAALIKAALGGGTGKPVLTDQPFIGLRAMTDYGIVIDRPICQKPSEIPLPPWSSKWDEGVIWVSPNHLSLAGI